MGLISMLTECNTTTLGESTSEVRHRVRRTEAEHCLGFSVLEPLHSLQIYSQPPPPFSVQFEANLCYTQAPLLLFLLALRQREACVG